MASLGRVSGLTTSRGVARSCTASAANSSSTRLELLPPFVTRLNAANAIVKASYSSDKRDNQRNSNKPHDHDDDGTITVNDDIDHGDRIASIIWQPNQTTTIFREMETTCPNAMKEYAQCVIEKQNSGALTRDACGVQFRAVMDCFRLVRTSRN